MVSKKKQILYRKILKRTMVKTFEQSRKFCKKLNEKKITVFKNLMELNHFSRFKLPCLTNVFTTQITGENSLYNTDTKHTLKPWVFGPGKKNLKNTENSFQKSYCVR